MQKKKAARAETEPAADGTEGSAAAVPAGSAVIDAIEEGGEE